MRRWKTVEKRLPDISPLLQKQDSNNNDEDTEETESEDSAGIDDENDEQPGCAPADRDSSYLPPPSEADEDVRLPEYYRVEQ